MPEIATQTESYIFDSKRLFNLNLYVDEQVKVVLSEYNQAQATLNKALLTHPNNLEDIATTQHLLNAKKEAIGKKEQLLREHYQLFFICQENEAKLKKLQQSRIETSRAYDNGASLSISLAPALIYCMFLVLIFTSFAFGPAVVFPLIFAIAAFGAGLYCAYKAKQTMKTETRDEINLRAEMKTMSFSTLEKLEMTGTELGPERDAPKVDGVKTFRNAFFQLNTSETAMVTVTPKAKTVSKGAFALSLTSAS